jgi:galactokinase
MVDADSLRKRFDKQFGGRARIYAAPGRVNLIGEHTDYNDGFVLPIAIDRSTFVAARVRDGRNVRVHSANAGQTLGFDLDAPYVGSRGSWLDYIEGTARVLESRGHTLRGADLLIESDVPEGAGLSSSAALEISTGLALLSLSEPDNGVDRVDLALSAQQAEHEYVGTKCGVMDQFISALARPGHALLIDCRHLDADPIPIETSDVAIAICDTNVKHALAASEYNTRRRECELSVEILRTALPKIRALRDVTLVDFDEHGWLLPEPLGRRARHVVTENVRTISAAIALRAGDFEKAGKLMLQSHLSLRDDYEVSSPELDAIVEIAHTIEGVFGARMTGGGFGGSAIALVSHKAMAAFQKTMVERFAAQTGRHTTIYTTEMGPGARELL